MIENIYSNVAGKEKEYPVSGRKPPKNVRQIGTFTGDFRIYVEDYVHTFTHWLAEQDHTERCVAVLIGEFAKSEHAREVYAYGTVTAKQACVDGKIEMSAQVWTQIYETIKQYFPDGEIVGWFCKGTSFTAEEKEEIFKVHLDHFAGADRILLLYDFLDQEEEFYRYEEGSMKRQQGYYIYYEKNTEMQDYMIDQKQGKGSEEEVNDRAVREVRARWNAEKKENEEEEEEKEKESGSTSKGSGNRFLYSVGVVMTAVALVAAVSMLYNQERLKGFEQTLNKLLGNAEEEEEPDTKEVSGKAKDGEEEQADEEDENGAMAWEITGGAPGKSGDREESSSSGMENAVDILDIAPGVTGAAPTDEENAAGGDEKSSIENEETESGKKTADDQSGNSTGEPGGNDLTEAGNGTGQNGKDASGDGTGSDEQSKDSQAEGENNDTENNSTAENAADEQDEAENTPKPGDAVQTGDIGGPGAAIDTSQMQIYTVKAGDTLVGICRKFYGNLDNLEYIKELNQLNNENLIYIDQELLLP